MNNMATIDYKPGQILYIKSSLGPWYYISVLNHAVKCTGSRYGLNSHELYTCCDLCIEEDGSECLTFTRGNSPFLDLDTTFAEVREATRDEIEYLYKALVKAFKDHDLGWYKHFTDSTYDDIRDWLCWEFDVDIDNMDDNNPLGGTIYEITNHIWDSLCKETGNYQACTDYEEPEMVNKEEFIAKVRNWLEQHTYNDKYWTSDGEDLFIGNLIDDICKYLGE